MVYIEDMRFPLPIIGTSPEPVAPDLPDSGSQLPADSIDPALLALAMGFVPVQAWEEPYAADLALARGTESSPRSTSPSSGRTAVSR